MEQLAHPLVYVYAVVWILELYLYGMQRASLLISRKNDVPWRGVGEAILPSWYATITWSVRAAKYILLGIILYEIGWKVALAIFGISYLLMTMIPFPYQAMYAGVFQKRVKQISQIDPETGQMLKDMLINSGFINQV